MASVEPTILIICPYCSNEINCDKYRLYGDIKRFKKRIKLCRKCNKRFNVIKKDLNLISKPLKKYGN